MFDLEDTFDFVPIDVLEFDKKRCHKCNEVPLYCFQTVFGNIKCKQCFDANDEDIVKQDVRLDTNVMMLQMKCSEHSMCDWTGTLNMFMHHILLHCNFSKCVCDHCKERVCLKNKEEHRNTFECRSFYNTNVNCPYNCGIQRPRWFMQTHKFENCLVLPFECPLEDNCACAGQVMTADEHWVTCVEKNFETIFDMMKRENKEMLEVTLPDVFQNNQNNVVNLCDMRLTFNNKYNLEMLFYCLSDFLRITIIWTDATSFVKKELWKNTRVFVTIVNRWIVSPPVKTINYTKELVLNRDCDSSIIFYEWHFIPMQ